MSQKSATLNPKPPAERVVRDIRRATRRHYSAEEVASAFVVEIRTT